MEWDSGNVRIRPSSLGRPGVMIAGHVHPFDHTAFHFAGGARIKAKLLNGTVLEQDFYSPVLAYIRQRLGHDMRKNQIHTLIHAGVSHELTAIQPTKAEALEQIAHLTEAEVRDILAGVMALPAMPWCVFSHRDPQGNVLQRNIGWLRAYEGLGNG